MTDIVIAQMSQLIRWGRAVTPVWVYGGEITAPPANTALVSVSVPSGKRGYIYGVYISADDANDFKINWTSNATSRSIRILLGSKGTVLAVFNTPINEGYPADPQTTITITNIFAGGPISVYQVGLLVAIV